jgi:signal transduction histidine kinase
MNSDGMRGLFLKIFFWFWLAMALVNVTFFLSLVLVQRDVPPAPWRYLMSPAMGVYAQTAADIYERDGRSALAAYLERVERTANIRAVVFNSQGEEISGRIAPRGADEIATRAAISGGVEFDPSRRPQLVAQTAITRNGDRYTLVGELLNNPLQSALTPDHRTLALRLLAVVLTGGILCYWLARYLTRPVIKLRATTQELADGNLTARVGPQIVKRRDELGHLGRDFNLMAERIESLVLAQRRLLGDISHELRSPLARLGVALGLARQRAGLEAASAHDRIEREAESLNEMIEQLLALTRLESGAEGVRKTSVDLASLVREVVDDAHFEARGLNRAVRLVACEECRTTGVPELLRSAIENVLRNAVRYTVEGTEVEVALRCGEEGDEAKAVISVRDHGKGVPEEVISNIFRPFYRVEDARDRQTGGAGLGLAITSRAVRLHGGTVTASNAPDGGLVVEIALPVWSSTV